MECGNKPNWHELLETIESSLCKSQGSLWIELQDLDVSPPNAIGHSGSNCLGAGLLTAKTPCEIPRGIASRSADPALVTSEYSLEISISEPIQRTPDPVY